MNPITREYETDLFLVRVKGKGKGKATPLQA
jgi:hypothetical protein